MKVKKEIHAFIERMEPEDLSRIYDYIKTIEVKGSGFSGRKTGDIESIQELTGKSKSNWADAVAKDREDRF